MKKKLSLLFVLLLAAVLVVACGNTEDEATTEDAEGTETAETEDLGYEPEDVSENDVCDVCAMAVPNDQHATQIVLTNDRSLKFDDIGCLHTWIDENGTDDIGAAFVRDYNTEEWIDIEGATFVYEETIETPMAYGVISFKDSEDAEAFIDDFGKGTIMTRDELYDHEWKMNKEMMDHGDHDDHDDHDDHGDEEDEE